MPRCNMLLCKVLLLVCIAFILSGAAPITDTDYVAGMALIQSGDGKNGTQRLRKAYAAHPSNPQIMFGYATVAPCSVAVELFTKCATMQKTPDSLRACAYKELGDFLFVQNAFRTAAEKYRLAAQLHALPRYTFAQARAFAAMNDTVQARPLFLKCMTDSGSAVASEARFEYALLDMKAGRFDSAYVRLSLTEDIDTARPWTIAAFAAQLECALRLGKKDRAATIEKKLAPYRSKLLEQSQLNLASVIRAPVRKPVPEEPGAAPQRTDAEYTLQVGAFGSLENATSLQKKLLATFADVTILPVTMAENVFYRVRIGTFKNAAKAESFAADSLTPAGIGFKVVEK